MRGHHLIVVILVVEALSCPASAAGVRDYLNRPEAWHRSEEGRRVAANVLSHQSAAGSWAKNTDTTSKPYEGDRSRIRGTFDNGATTGELTFLARAFRATNDDACRRGFLLGLDHILQAQYRNGGWPQFHPPGDGYARHITFNDETMVRLMRFVREVAMSEGYAFVDEDRRDAAANAFERGIECIVKCQVRVDGKLTAWCAQHDEAKLEPRPARSYELVSLSGSESVGIVRLLMSIEEPSPAVIEAVDAAVAWLDAAKLTGIRVDRVPDPAAPKGTNKVVVNDPTAPPMWARFHEIGTNRPIYADRDGVIKRNLADIGYERSNGYGWLGTWGQPVLEKEYPAWKQRLKR
jgi:pectate lyase